MCRAIARRCWCSCKTPCNRGGELNPANYDSMGTQIVDSRDIWSPGRLLQLSFCFGLALFVLILVVLITGMLADAFLSVRVIRETELMLLGIAVVSMSYSVWGITRWRIQLSTPSRRLFATIGATAGVTCVPCLVLILDSAHEFHDVVIILLLPAGLFVLWFLFVSATWLFVENAKPFKIQYEPSCPQCGYCVRGVTSRICPECGRAFCETDLGLSTSEFNSLVSGETSAPIAEQSC